MEAKLKGSGALEVICSDRLEVLSGALANRIAADRGDSPLAMFDPAVVVAPNRELATFVELDLARRQGIAANVKFPFLETFFTHLIPSNADFKVLDSGTLHSLIDHVLATGGPDFEPACDYIAAGDGDEARDRRRFLLARRLAMLFVDYRLSLPELVDGWKSGPAMAAIGGPANGRSPAGEESAAWQRALWRAVFGPGGATDELFDRTGTRWLLLPDAIAAVGAENLAIASPVHLIGFSILAPAYVAMLEQIARHRKVTVYSVSPSPKLWDDLRADDPDASLIARWGIAGRETYRQLHRATDGNLNDAGFVDEVPRSLLANLQRAVRDLEDPAARIATANLDGSLEVLACPSQRRELEIVARKIWDLVNADKSLRFSDIAVLVAGDRAASYLAQIRSVFRTAAALPHHTVGLPLTAESRLGEGLSHLLALPGSRFSRLEVLRAITHPAIAGRFAAADPQRFIRLAGDLGIAHGADAADHQDTYIKDGRYHWDWGIRRLALGAFMDAHPDPGAVPTVLGDSEYLHLPLASDGLEGAVCLARLARALIADCQRLSATTAPLADWARTLERLATDYLVTDGDGDERTLERIRDAARRLGDRDLFGEPVGFVTAREHLLAALSGLTASMGHNLGGGVFVAPLVPRRPLPYRVIFCVGLSEGDFPSQRRPSPLDLRRDRPGASALLPAARDRYAFLETLISARDKLVLSYVARNDISGEARNPASVVVELCDAVAAGLGAGARDALVVTESPVEDGPPPEGAPFICPLPDAHRQAQARAVRASAMAAIRDRGLPPPRADDLAAALSALPALCQRFGLVPPAGPIDPRDRPRLALSVSALTRFLEDPLQGWAGVVIGLSQDDDEDASAAAVEDEPFTSERREVLPMIRRVFAEVMAADVPGGLPVLIARYREEAHRMMLAGTAPAGAFAEAERDHHERWLGCWHAGVSGRGRLRSVRFGAGAEALCLDVPLAAGAAGTPVEITGDAGLVIEGVGPVVLHHRPDIAPRIRLGVLARHAILAAAGILADLEVTGLIIADGGIKNLAVAPWSRDEARDYLTTIAGELFGGAHAYILPGDKALDWLVATHKHANPAPAKKRAAKRPAAKKPIAPLSDKIRADKYKPFGPIDRFSDLDVPDDAEDIAFRRLDPLARRWRS